MAGLSVRLGRWVGRVAILGLLSCSSDTRDAAARDLLLGTWDAVEGTAYGVPVSGSELGLTLTFSPEKVVWAFRTPEGVKVHDGVYRHDASRVPKEIDLAQPEGQDPHTFSLGIYTLEEDRLQIHMGAARPRSYSEETMMRLVFEPDRPDR